MSGRQHGFVWITAVLVAASLSAQTVYRKPSKEILAVLDAPETPALFVSPARDHALLGARLRYPPIGELAQPMLRLAGTRINPKTNGPHRAPDHTGLSLLRLRDAGKTELRLPTGARVSAPYWSPNGALFAFTNTRDDGIELWIGETAKASVRRMASPAVNAVLGTLLHWLPDSRTLLFAAVPPGRGRPPSKPEVPDGPVVQEATGASGPVRTYQDLLQNAYDEALFDYYATSHLVLLDVQTGKAAPIGKPGLIESARPSPDGQFFFVTRLLRPYSYLHPYGRFPLSIEIWNRFGELVRELARQPLADNIPIDGVRTGPRLHRWHPTEPATLLWVEALDGGDPRRKVPHRDRIFELQHPFSASPRELARLEHRFDGLEWLETGETAFLSDYDRNRRWRRTFLLPRDGGDGQLLWSRSIQDRYADPGAPVARSLPNGHRAIHASGGRIFLRGPGASPQGDRPFLDRYELATRSAQRLFHCDAESFEETVAVLDDEGRRLLTRHESLASPPNYLIRGEAPAALTDFRDPAPQLRTITKRLVAYKRADGVPLSFTLYLPPGYRDGERLPSVVWAYPREYNTPDTAGQVTGSTKRFTMISGANHLFFLLAGYAVLDGAAMPVVGDPETANNTYVEQIVSSAQAAIDEAARLGVTDPRRAGVGGHSYGAFMTVNLLAHSDLFRAGIARSGAYNRTLTPFGFQAERRTFWEAPETYLRMSPFMVAHKINEPVLLIHGAADNNEGTFPMQSERLYQAIRGNGGTVRYVVLPHESHSYTARESVEHVIAEMIDWFDQHVKPPR